MPKTKAQTSLCTIGLPSNHNATRGFRPHRCAVGFLIAFVPFSHVPWWCSRRIACWRPACSACGWHRRDSRRSSGGWTPSRGGDRRCRRRFRAWPTSCSCRSFMPLLPSFTFLSCLLSLFLIKKRGGQRPQQIVGRSRRMLLMDTFTVHVHVPVRKKMLHM